MRRLVLKLIGCLLVVFFAVPVPTSFAGELKSKKGGVVRWSDPDTWGGRLPGPDDEVTIESGTTVELDTDAAEVHYMFVNGTLRFRRDMSTKLTVQQGSIEIGSGGRMLVGTPDNPIKLPHTAEIEMVVPEAWNYRSCDQGNRRVSWGIWNDGLLEIHGQSYENTWLWLAQTAQAGTNELVLDGDASDWPIGGQVEVGVIRRDLGGPFGDPIDFIVRRTIQKVEPERTGNSPRTRVTLDRPLEYTALSTYGYWGAVGLLSRNVKVHGSSYNNHDMPHVWWRHGNPGSASYAEFYNLGPMGDHNFPSSDSQPPVACWSVHYHGNDNGLVGLSVHDFGRMGIVNHRNVRGYAFHNVIAGRVMSGAGFYNEEEGNTPGREITFYNNLVLFPHSYRLNPNNPQSSTFHRPIYLTIPGNHSVIGNAFWGGYYGAYLNFAGEHRDECLEYQYNVNYSSHVGMLLVNYRPERNCPEIKGNVSAVHDYSIHLAGVENVTVSDCIVATGVLTNFIIQGHRVNVKNCHIFSTPSPWGGDVQRAVNSWSGAEAFRFEGSDIHINDTLITGHYDYAAIGKDYREAILLQAKFTNLEFAPDEPYRDWFREKLATFAPAGQRPDPASLFEFRNYSGIYSDELGANFDFAPAPPGEQSPYFLHEGYVRRQ